jgi:Fe-S cluster assembly protein SufD
MNALQQYIDLYQQNRQLINDNAPTQLNQLRDEALDTLSHSRLPKRGDEGYEMSDIEAMFAPDLGINLARIPFNADIAAAFKCDVPNISTLLGVVANDIFRPTEALLKRLPDGMVVTSFSEAAKLMPQVLESYYAKVANSQDATIALNTLLAQDGILVYVPRGVQCEKAIQLVNLLHTPTSMLVARRMLIVLEENASCRILNCDHTVNTNNSDTSLGVVEIVLKRGASLEWYDIEEANSLTSKCSHIAAQLDNDASLRINTTILTCGKTRNSIRVNLAGEHASCHIAGMAFADHEQVADTSATVIHSAPRCDSDQLFKYVIDGQARGSFEGLILVKQDSHHTAAYQNNKNIVCSPQARMHTRPQLEIYCDDVKCSHGAATGQLDERAMFYMRSRGIPEKEARTMLTQAFMADVIDTVSLEPLRDRLRHLVEKRLTLGLDSASCDNCAIH